MVAGQAVVDRSGRVPSFPTVLDFRRHDRRASRGAAMPRLQCERVAAALVSPNGHRTIRRSPNFLDSNFPGLFSDWKGVTMRIFTASDIIAVVSLATPAFVQPQGAASQPQAQTPPAQSSPVIRSIQVVDVKNLKPALRTKCDDVISPTSQDAMNDLSKLI